MSRVIVTGGAGFIGSHLVKTLCEKGHDVTAIDNFSCGFRGNLADCDRSRLTIVEMDLVDMEATIKALKGADIVYHLAADPDVKTSLDNPAGHYENNIHATYNVLEAMRQHGIVDILFFSSSVVYGEAEVMPTPEDYTLHPISIYGSTKLACEVLIQGYTEAFGIRALMVRPANVIGINGTHGVILDFIRKLKATPGELEILGDGKQEKSYLHVSDLIAAILMAQGKFKASDKKSDIYNLGSLDTLSVMEIASLVISEMGLKGTKLKLTGGVDGGRGWIGDVKVMLLSIDKLKGIGWEPSMSSKEAVARSIRELIPQL